VAPLSEDLSKVAVIGLESLELIKENKKADPLWVTASNEILKAAAIPKGEIEIAILSSIQKLFARANK